MLLWHITSAKYAQTASEGFNGIGGTKAEGRWNLAQLPVVYTATSESLAILESLAHFDPTRPPAAGLVLLRAELPESVPVDDARIIGLPADWNALPPAASTKNLGAAWLRSRSTVAFKVPSAIAQRGSEVRVLLNPSHPKFSLIQLFEPVPFTFDGRLT